MPKNWPADTITKHKGRKTEKTSRKKNHVEYVETVDGFTKIKLVANISLDCFSCGGFPREFYWKTRQGKQTEVYCLTCERINKRER